MHHDLYLNLQTHSHTASHIHTLTHTHTQTHPHNHTPTQSLTNTHTHTHARTHTGLWEEATGGRVHRGHGQWQRCVYERCTPHEGPGLFSQPLAPNYRQDGGWGSGEPRSWISRHRWLRLLREAVNSPQLTRIIIHTYEVNDEVVVDRYDTMGVWPLSQRPWLLQCIRIGYIYLAFPNAVLSGAHRKVLVIAVALHLGLKINFMTSAG